MILIRQGYLAKQILVQKRGKIGTSATEEEEACGYTGWREACICKVNSKEGQISEPWVTVRMIA
jgi:hypothetical protein